MRFRVLLLTGATLLAASGVRAQVQIDSAVPDTSGVLQISGRGFGTAARVELGGRTLPVIRSTDVLVQASLAAAPPAGTFRLRVTRGTPPRLSGDFVVTLGAVGPPGPAGPPGPPATAADLALDVDCAAGESVSAALLASAALVGRISITVHGVCRENVRIERDDVSIASSAAGDGFEATGATPALVAVRGRRIRLSGLTLNAAALATDGLFVDGAAELSASNVTVREAAVGMEVVPGGMAFLDACVFLRETRRTSGAPLVGILSASGTVVSGGGQIRGPFDVGVSVRRGSWMSSGDLIEGSDQGLYAADGAAVQITGARIDDIDQQGILASGNASVRMIGGEIRGALIGVEAEYGAFVTLQTAAGVKDGGAGVIARQGSALWLVGANLENNRGNGVEVHDTSTLAAAGFSIVNNGAVGLQCTDVPSPGQLLGPFTAAEISGNARGQVAGCPGLTLP